MALDLNRVATYIHLQSEDFKKEANIDSMTTFFTNSFKQNISILKREARIMQARAILANNKLQNINNNITAETLADMENGTFLPKLMEYVAQGLQEGLNQTAKKSEIKLEDKVKDLYKFANALEFKDGSQDFSNLEKFFSTLQEVLSYCYKDIIKENDLKLILESVKTKFTTGKGVTKKATRLNIDTFDKIIEYLENAAKKFRYASKGSPGKYLKKESFRQTIQNITALQLAEPMAAIAMTNASKVFNNVFENGLKTTNSKVTFDHYNSGKGQFERTINTRRKADIINPNSGLIFNIETDASENGDTRFQLEIGTNISVKLHIADNPILQIVSGTPIKKYFEESVGSANGKYYAYNLMIHSGSDSEYNESFRAMRASTAAFAFNEWLMGNVGKGNVKEADAQFFYVNGKIYSMLSIIEKVFDQFAALGSSDENIVSENTILTGYGRSNNSQLVLTYEHRGAAQKENVKKPGPNEPNNTRWALSRAKAVRELVDKITIATRFNINILDT